MVKRVMCPKCGAICEYDDKSVWEGNRDFEDVECPICGYVLATVFTDLLPKARVIQNGGDEQLTHEDWPAFAQNVGQLRSGEYG